MDLSSEGETEEHLQLMKLLMCQSEEHDEQNTESRLQTAGGAGVQIMSTENLVFPHVNIMGSVTQAGMSTNIQPDVSGQSLLQMSEEMNRQILKEELPMFPDSADIARFIDSIPTNGQALHLEQKPFDLTQNLENISRNNILPPYGLVNFDANDSDDLEDPALSAVGLDFFETSDMIASSEKDLDQFNRIFQSEESKPIKEKKSKEKSAVPKKQTGTKKPVPKDKPKKTLDEAKVPHWAKEYLHLFKSQRSDFKTEKQFNEKNSLKYPFCSVCALVQPRVVTYEMTNPKAVDNGPANTKPPRTTPDVIDIYKRRLSATLSAKTEGSLLLQCVSCKVCVHAFCYGEAEMGFEWMCTRCIKGDMNATCCLCNLRGGALTLTTKNRWCHIVCALFNTDTNFTEKILAGSIDVSNIPKTRKAMKCGYCSSFHDPPEVAGGIVQCTTAKCRFPFHVTCGHAAGVVYQPDTKHFPVFVMCHKHLENSGQKQKGTKREFPELQVGDKVISKHKNNRYYTCEITNIQQDLFCKAAFEDGSLSSNLYPEDFQKLKIRKEGPPKLDSQVEVLWRPDGLIYKAIFKGTLYIPFYEVRFDDGSRVDVNRDDVYTLTEKLPMKVKLKLSEVTLVPITGDQGKSSGEAKRARQPNPLYFGRSYVKK